MKFKIILEKSHLLSILKDKPLLQLENKLTNLNTNISIEANHVTTYHDNNFIYTSSKDKIRIYSPSLLEMSEFYVKNSVGVDKIFSLESLIISTYESEQRKSIFIKEGLIIKEINSFFGKILNERFRLNFSEGVFVKPSSFRVSDLLDNKTYWEYKCSADKKATNLWIVRGDYLIFFENKFGTYVGNINKIHLTTGQIKWSTEIANINLHYNENLGLLVSFWANNELGKNYQIIDIDNETIETGYPNTDYELLNVNTLGETQYLAERKLYFIDSTNAYGKDLPIVKFGRFDLDTKKIDFLQEVPEANGIGFLQVIYHEFKLYLRSYDNKLYIFEHESHDI